MARESVVKAEIVCHSARKNDVLSALESLGGIHLIDISDREDMPLQPFSGIEEGEQARLVAALSRTIPFLQDLQEKKRSGSASPRTVEQLDRLSSDRELRESVFRASEIFDRLNDLKASIRETEGKLAFIRRWEDLPVDFSEMNRQGLFSLRAGSVSPGEGFKPLEELELEQSLFSYTRLSDSRALVLWHTDVEETVLNALTESGFAGEDFSGYDRTPAEELDLLNSSLSRAMEESSSLHGEADLLSLKLPDFKALFDAASLQGFRNRAVSSGRKSSTSVLLHGWVRSSEFSLLKERLESLGEVDIQKVDPEEGEIPPVHLSENTTADPYLMLTDMYGRPNGADPDPTPHMAPFYAIFFGICIGDAGYGIALAAGSAIGWYLTKKRQGNTRLFRLLFQGGLASVFWGVLLGGWFGAPLQSLPSFLQAAAAPLNSLVPSGESFSLSNQFLYLTLVFGVIQLAWGVVVNLQKMLREGEGFAAFVDQSGWMLSLLGLFPWLFDHYLFNIYDNTGAVDSILMGMLGAGALLIFIMGGREATNIGGKVGLGAYACYGIVNLLGDVLSYSRLFALALSSAIIASVINDIAGMLSGSIPVLGFILAVLVLAGGHLFNLAMAVLSGFIHTARLQFVEFFGKFYDGTGVPFTPLRYEPKYVRIER